MTTHTQSVPRLRVRGAIPPFHVAMAWTGTHSLLPGADRLQLFSPSFMQKSLKTENKIISLTVNISLHFVSHAVCN